uniref:Uncharacterized protein n=1 Tax=Oncorhynchus mykiss TaxID=8022 RepID=A0A8K9UEM3_ONCMY
PTPPLAAFPSSSLLPMTGTNCGFPELQNPGLSLDHFQLACVENRTVDNSNRADLDMHLEPIQPSVSVSPHGRFERLQKDPNYISHFTRAPPKGQWRSSCSLVRYMLAGVGLFILGFLIGHYTHRPAHPRIPRYTDHLQELLKASFGNLPTLYQLAYDSIEAKAKQLYQQWTYLGLKDIQQASYSILLSLTGPSPSSIVHWDSHQCFLPSGAQLDPRNHNNNPTADQHLSYAACYAKGSLGVQHIYPVLFSKWTAECSIPRLVNAMFPSHLLVLHPQPLLSNISVSLLADMGFGGVLLYMDPCDSPSDQSLWHKEFGVNLNPWEDSSTPGYYREQRPNLTSLLVQPISASLAKRLLNIQSVELGSLCTPLAMPARQYLSHHHSIPRFTSTVFTSYHTFVCTLYLEAILWPPETSFYSLFQTAEALSCAVLLQENRMMLQSHAIAFVSLHSPVRGTDTLRATASFSLLQLLSFEQTKAEEVLRPCRNRHLIDNTLWDKDIDVSCCSVSPPCTCNSPFLPGVCVDVLKRSPRGPPDCWQLLPPSESSAFLQSETMCPANDPKDRDPSHVRMLNTCSWTWRRYPFLRNLQYMPQSTLVNFFVLSECN